MAQQHAIEAERKLLQIIDQQREELEELRELHDVKDEMIQLQVGWGCDPAAHDIFTKAKKLELLQPDLISSDGETEVSWSSSLTGGHTPPRQRRTFDSSAFTEETIVSVSCACVLLLMKYPKRARHRRPYDLDELGTRPAWK